MKIDWQTYIADRNSDPRVFVDALLNSKDFRAFRRDLIDYLGSSENINSFRGLKIERSFIGREEILHISWQTREDVADQQKSTISLAISAIGGTPKEVHERNMRDDSGLEI